MTPDTCACFILDPAQWWVVLGPSIIVCFIPLSFYCGYRQGFEKAFSSGFEQGERTGWSNAYSEGYYKAKAEFEKKPQPRDTKGRFTKKA